MGKLADTAKMRNPPCLPLEPHTCLEATLERKDKVLAKLPAQGHSSRSKSAFFAAAQPSPDPPPENIVLRRRIGAAAVIHYLVLVYT